MYLHTPCLVNGRSLPRCFFSTALGLLVTIPLDFQLALGRFPGPAQALDPGPRGAVAHPLENPATRGLAPWNPAKGTADVAGKRWMQDLRTRLQAEAAWRRGRGAVFSGRWEPFDNKVYGIAGCPAYGEGGMG